MARAECLAPFVDGFGLPGPRHLLVSANNQQVAGIALVEDRHWRLFHRFSSANNPWLQCGGLLTDKQQVSTNSFRRLAEQIKRLPVAWVTLDWTFETVEMARLVDQLQLAGCRVVRQRQFDAGIVHVRGDWNDYLAKLSSSFRKKLKANLRKLNQHGKVSFERYSTFANRQQMLDLIGKALEIEHSGWKGQQGSSLNSQPQIRQHFIDMLIKVAAAGMLEIQFLKIAGQRIAFEIGFRSHGIYYSYKIGFDPDYARYSPGQLLMYFQMQHWFEGEEIHKVDSVGEINKATSKWCHEFATRYRYTIATRVWSAAMLRLTHQLKPFAKRLLIR